MDEPTGDFGVKLKRNLSDGFDGEEFERRYGPEVLMKREGT